MGLIRFGNTDLGPAAKALVEKIASATGTLWQPIDKILNAYADAKVDQIKAIGELEKHGLLRRTAERWLAEEARKQENLEAIYGKTIAMLEPSVDPENVSHVDNDLLVFHSERARIVSDDEMQTLFARILSEEVSAPGSFSKRTIDFLATLEKADALAFTELCRYVVEVRGEKYPLVFHDDDEEFAGPRSNILSHLDAIGLIQEEHLTAFGIYSGSTELPVRYFSETRLLDVSKTVPAVVPPHIGERTVPISRVQFTSVGRQLQKICGAEPISNFWEKVTPHWERRNIKLLATTVIEFRAPRAR